MTEQKKSGWRFLIYLPAVVKALFNTFLHLIKAKGHRTFTIPYPEQQPPTANNCPRCDDFCVNEIGIPMHSEHHVTIVQMVL